MLSTEVTLTVAGPQARKSRHRLGTTPRPGRLPYAGRRGWERPLPTTTAPTALTPSGTCSWRPRTASSLDLQRRRVGTALEEMLADGSFKATEDGIWVTHEDVNPATGEVEDKHFWRSSTTCSAQAGTTTSRGARRLRCRLAFSNPATNSVQMTRAADVEFESHQVSRLTIGRTVFEMWLGSPRAFQLSSGRCSFSPRLRLRSPSDAPSSTGSNRSPDSTTPVHLCQFEMNLTSNSWRIGNILTAILCRPRKISSQSTPSRRGARWIAAGASTIAGPDPPPALAKAGAASRFPLCPRPNPIDRSRIVQ